MYTNRAVTNRHLGPVNVLWIARYDYEPGWSVLPHAHDFFQLLCTIDGSGTVALEDSEIPLSEDTVVLLPPRVSHRINADAARPLKTLDTKFEVVDDELLRVLRLVQSPILDDTHLVRRLLERIRTEGIERLGGYRYLCNALLVECLVSLVSREARQNSLARDSAGESCTDSIVELAKNFIDVHYAENIGSRTIAEYVGYSPDYLAKRFSQAIGMSLHNYLVRLRIEKAKEMLTYEELSVKEVAFLVGFKTIHHFSRAFKEVEGLPPATWRNRERAGVWRNVVIAPGFENTDLTITNNGSSAVSPRRRSDAERVS